MDIGKTSYFAIHDSLTAQQTADLARRVEDKGYGALWLVEAFGREIISHAAFLLANTKTLVIATGIANIYARDAAAMAAAQLSLNEQFGGRFLLGIGVSHSQLVSDMRGHTYGKPIATMRAYLEGMRSITYGAPKPAETPKTILAALRPKMLALAAEQADGALPVWTPPEHTARAREIMGKGKQLIIVQNVILETDPAKARAAARIHAGLSLTLPNYRENLKWLGFTDDDFANNGSDRLMDAVIAWGDEAAIRKRIDAHFAAGADHVCISPISATPNASMDPDLRGVDIFAPGRA